MFHQMQLRRRRGRQKRRGTIIVLSAILMIMMMGLLAFSLDTGYVYVNRATLQKAADSAAIAAVISLSPEIGDDPFASAVSYGNSNVPTSYGEVITTDDVELGVWDAAARTFTPDNQNPTAVRVTCRRLEAPLIFARFLGHETVDVEASAVATGPVYNYANYTSVYVTSTKDLSNVVLEFEDGEHQKFEGLSGHSGTFAGTEEHYGKQVVTVWVKSGCNSSNDGPGYGERFDRPEDDVTLHGQPAQGCVPHCTVTFEATGPDFESGSEFAYRLVE